MRSAMRWCGALAPLAVVAALFPLPAAAAQAVSTTAGTSHTCALTIGGGVKCWGANSFGQLGDGTTADRLTPVDVSGLTSGVVAVAAGGYHTCALTSGGGVRCWGRNDYGALGDSTFTNRLTPVDVSGLTSGVAAVAVGDAHTCALTTEGGVTCWGANDYGELGDGTQFTNRSTPVQVSGLTSGVVAVAAGGLHTCAVTSGGGVMCWGFNERGELGDGTAITRLTPVDVSGLTSGVAAVAAGGAHTCALTTGGGVMCWGRNLDGQLGDGTATVSRLTPVDVSGLTSGVVAVATGGSHTCAVTSDGGVMCWGADYYGQLGDGTSGTYRTTPGAVSGLTGGVLAMAAGADYTCAVRSGGVKCWGDNSGGQLGDGTTITRLRPLSVRGFGLGILRDFDGDGMSDAAVYRPSTGEWRVVFASHYYDPKSGYLDVSWGAPGDMPVAGDYDGDGQADMMVFRPTTGEWWGLLSSQNYDWQLGYVHVYWGLAGDVPMSGDYDGDGRSDLVLFRPTTGEWWGLLSSQNYDWRLGYLHVYWGLAGDVPVSGDYDGDGKSDLMVFRPTTGTWWGALSTKNYDWHAGYLQVAWGGPGDTPLSGDFDGDGLSDLMVFRPMPTQWGALSTAQWWGALSTKNYDWHAGYFLVTYGMVGDLLAPGDHDGDGLTDVVVFRPRTGVWWGLRSSYSYNWLAPNLILHWGAAGDVPVVAR